MTSRGGVRNASILAVVIALIAAGIPFAPTSFAQSQPSVVASPTPRSSSKCVGAAATWTKGCTFTGTKLHQSAAAAAKDRPNVYGDNCWNFPPRFDKRIVCKYGAKKPKFRIAVIGNSHAGHWVPALLPLLKKNKSWRVDTYLLSSCYTVNARITVNENSATAATPEECRKASIWSVRSAIKKKYDLVIVSNRTATAPLTGVASTKQASTAQALYSRVLTNLANGGTRTLVIRDTPLLTARSPECIKVNPSNWNACATPRTQALEIDPLALAAAAHRSPLVTLVDPTQSMCSREKCQAVIGGLIARFDNSHLTHTFSRSFSPRINTWIRFALARGPRIVLKKANAGTVKRNRSKIVKVRVTNRGSSGAKLVRIQVKGSGFNLNRASTCRKNLKLAPNQTCKVRIRFSPKSKGTKKAALSVKYKLGSSTITRTSPIVGLGR